MSTVKSWYVLTDGDEIFDFRQMDTIDYAKATQIMIESTDGARTWRRVPRIKIDELIERSR